MWDCFRVKFVGRLVRKMGHNYFNAFSLFRFECRKKKERAKWIFITIFVCRLLKIKTNLSAQLNNKLDESQLKINKHR